MVKGRLQHPTCLRHLQTHIQKTHYVTKPTFIPSHVMAYTTHSTFSSTPLTAVKKLPSANWERLVVNETNWCIFAPYWEVLSLPLNLVAFSISPPLFSIISHGFLVATASWVVRLCVPRRLWTDSLGRPEWNDNCVDFKIMDLRLVCKEHKKTGIKLTFPERQNETPISHNSHDDAGICLRQPCNSSWNLRFVLRLVSSKCCF